MRPPHCVRRKPIYCQHQPHNFARCKSVFFSRVHFLSYSLLYAKVNYYFRQSHCGPNLIHLIAKGYVQIVSDVSVDVSDVSEVFFCVCRMLLETHDLMKEPDPI